MGEFKFGGFYEPTIPDSSYSIVIINNEKMPDPRTQKWNGNDLTAKTAQEIAAYDANIKIINFTSASRQKDVLATIALVVRARGITAWNNMTIQQKKDATLAEADVWINIRQFIEDNL